MKSKKTLVMGGKAKAVNLRLPVNLHQKIIRRAETEGKSINLVIVESLERDFGGNEGTLSDRKKGE